MSTAPRRQPPRAPGPRRDQGRDEQARQERLEQLHTRLSEQVLSLTSGPAWAQWLTTAARFHHYSFRNTVAIWAQRPGATQVAGYRVWQSLGRQVRKGEQGIQILAPITRRVENDDDPPSAGQPAGAGAASAGSTTPGDPAAPAATPRKLVGYRIVHVFDISQTDGDPLPRSEVRDPALLTGAAPDHLWDGLARQVHEEGFTLALETLPVANGMTTFADRVVTVRPDLEPAQRVKTLAHELAHVTMHGPGEADAPDPAASTPVCRGRVEVEAESVAFLVTSAHGLDSSAYSFPYIAGWAHESDTDTETILTTTGTRVLATANQILDRLDRDNPQPLPLAEDAVPFDVTPAADRRPQPHTPAAVHTSVAVDGPATRASTGVDATRPGPGPSR